MLQSNIASQIKKHPIVALSVFEDERRDVCSTIRVCSGSSSNPKHKVLVMRTLYKMPFLMLQDAPVNGAFLPSAWSLSFVIQN
jgi:hypothetical protein